MHSIASPRPAADSTDITIEKVWVLETHSGLRHKHSRASLREQKASLKHDLHEGIRGSIRVNAQNRQLQLPCTVRRQSGAHCSSMGYNSVRLMHGLGSRADGDDVALHLPWVLDALHIRYHGSKLIDVFEQDLKLINPNCYCELTIPAAVDYATTVALDDYHQKPAADGIEAEFDGETALSREIHPRFRCRHLR